jgi:hypothetical protein
MILVPTILLVGMGHLSGKSEAVFNRLLHI